MKTAWCIFEAKPTSQRRTTQSDSKRQEQVFSHTLDSSSEDEPLRMTRPDPRIHGNTNDFKVEIPKFEGKLDPEEFLDLLHMV